MHTPRRHLKLGRLAAGTWLTAVIAGAAAVAQDGTAASRERNPSTSVYFTLDEAGERAGALVETDAVIAAASTYYVEPPALREFAVHDLITIIVDENVRTSNEHTLETERETEIESEVAGFADPWELINLRLRAAGVTDFQLVEMENSAEFTGDGQASTVNRFSAQITAEVVDVKPNGNLIIQAQRVVETDDLKTTLTLTGTVRQADVTDNNTVRSSQIAQLDLQQEQEGVIRDAARKSWFFRVLEMLFT